MSAGVSGVLTQRINGVLTAQSIVVSVIGTGVTINNVTIVSGGSTVEKTASGALGGHRVVISDGALGAAYADNSIPSHAALVLGVTNGAAVDGAPVSITVSGDLAEPSWSWTPDGFVYLSTNGLLTQTAPASGFSLIVGTALTPTVLNIRIGVPIILS